MSAILKDVQCFDVEIALSKALGRKVETFLVDTRANLFKFRIGFKWNLVVDGDQLGQLWNDCDQLSVLRDTFNDLKAECLGFQSHK